MKNKKILFSFIIISILAFSLEVKMNNCILRQEKNSSIRSSYDKKHTMEIKLKPKKSLAKDMGILYTEEDRNKIVKILCKESGILLVEMNEYDNLKYDLPTGELRDNQSKRQKIMSGNPNFGYSYLVKVEKGEWYDFKVLPKAENLILKAQLINDDVKKINSSGTYLQGGKGKVDEKIINLDRKQDFNIGILTNNSKKEKVYVKILKKKGNRWIKEKEMKVVTNERCSYSNMGKGKYKLVVKASKDVIYEMIIL